jgi:DNA-binding beta-propeller fold protein YncE
VVTAHGRPVVRRSAGIAAFLVLLIGVMVGAANAAPVVSAGLPLHHTRDVVLPGHATRFDYQTVDPISHRLYIAHLGDSAIDVVDLDTLQVVGVVAGIDSVHGVALASDRHQLYATATGINQLITIDTTTDQVIGRTPTGAFPDGVAYDPDHGLIFVSDKDAGSLTVIAADTRRVVATIKIADETGNVAYDPTLRLAYVTARTPERLVVIDPQRRTIIARVPLHHCSGAHGVFLDGTSDRAFVACERNARLVSVDLTDRRQTGTASVGTDPDVLAFDAGLHRLYIAAESGTVTVLDTSAAKATRIGQAHLANAAHSVAVDQTTHDTYFPLENIDGRPVLRVMTPVR